MFRRAPLILLIGAVAAGCSPSIAPTASAPQPTAPQPHPTAPGASTPTLSDAPAPAPSAPAAPQGLAAGNYLITLAPEETLACTIGPADAEVVADCLPTFPVRWKMNDQPWPQANRLVLHQGPDGFWVDAAVNQEEIDAGYVPAPETGVIGGVNVDSSEEHTARIGPLVITPDAYWLE